MNRCRLRDFHGYVRELGLPEFRPPMAVSSPLPFLAAPLRHRGEGVGSIYVGEKEREFTAEDEETLVMFASQAALVIANARRHRDEQRPRADLETLVNTTPVGVLVLDARMGNPVSINREARRIVSGLCEPGGTAEQLLEVLTFRRADGREVSLEEFPLLRRAGPEGGYRRLHPVPRQRLRIPGRSAAALPLRQRQGDHPGPGRGEAAGVERTDAGLFPQGVGFELGLCRPYRAQTKGKVDSWVKYVRRNMWPSIRFTEDADLNR